MAPHILRPPLGSNLKSEQEILLLRLLKDSLSLWLTALHREGEGGSEMDNCCSFANWHLFRLQNVFVTICWLARMIIHKYQCSTINRWDDDCMEERTCCFEMAMADYWSAMAIGRWQLFGDRRNHFLRSRWQTARSPSAPSELWL